MAVHNTKTKLNQDKANISLHKEAVNYILANLEGSYLLESGMVKYDNDCYNVIAHRAGNDNKMVVDYLKLPTYHNIIFLNPVAKFTKKIYIISADNLKDMVDAELEVKSTNVQMSKMVVDILDNAGLCVTIDLDWLMQFGVVQMVTINGGKFKVIKKYVPDELEGVSKEMLVKQYEPLINKLTAQFYNKALCDWDTIKSMAYEGFAIAMKDYDSTRSNLTFMQFAANMMNNIIKTRLTEESRTVKLPYYEQDKLKKEGVSTYNTISIDHTYNSDGDDEGLKPRETVMGMYEVARFDDGDVFEYLYQRLEAEFPMRDCEMFYMTFGLKGLDERSNQDIAKYFNVSEGLISQKKKKIIAFIRKDTELCEMLANL